MSLAALEAKPLSPREHTRAMLLEITQHTASEEQLKKFEDILEALEGARGPGSTRTPYTMDEVMKSTDGHERLFVFVGQDPDDCVMRPVVGRKPFGLLDTERGHTMKNLMFLYGFGWHPGVADALLVRSDFTDVCSKKLKKVTGHQLRADVKGFLTDAVKKARLSKKVELHLVGFGVGASALLATADGGGSLRPDALGTDQSEDGVYVDGDRHVLPWATVTGSNVAVVDVFPAGGGERMASFVLSAFLHTSALGGDQAANFNYFAGAHLRAHLHPPSRRVRLELRAGASLKDKCLF